MHRGMRGSKINQAALSGLRASRLRSRQRLRQVDMTRERDRSELSRYVDQHRTAVAPPDRPCPPQETQDQGGVVYKVASPNNVDAHSGHGAPRPRTSAESARGGCPAPDRPSAPTGTRSPASPKPPSKPDVQLVERAGHAAPRTSGLVRRRRLPPARARGPGRRVRCFRRVLTECVCRVVGVAPAG